MEKVNCSPWNNCDMIDGICGRRTVSDCFSLSPCRRHLDNVLQCAVLIMSCTSESSIIFKPGPWQISQSGVRFLFSLTHTLTGMAFNQCSETLSKASMALINSFPLQVKESRQVIHLCSDFTLISQEVRGDHKQVKECKQVMKLIKTIFSNRYHINTRVLVWNRPQLPIKLS